MMRKSYLHWCEANFVLGRLILRIWSRVLGRVGFHGQDLLLGPVNSGSGALPRGGVGGVGRDRAPVCPRERRQGRGQRARSRRRERDAVRRSGTGVVAAFTALELHIVLREALYNMVRVKESVLAVDSLEALFRARMGWGMKPSLYI